MNNVKNEIWATVRRANGNVETVNLYGKIGYSMTKEIAAKVRAVNAKVGTEVIRIWTVQTKSNIMELERKWNLVNNEGGEGYVPDMTKHPEYKVWDEVTEY